MCNDDVRSFLVEIVDVPCVTRTVTTFGHLLLIIIIIIIIIIILIIIIIHHMGRHRHRHLPDLYLYVTSAKTGGAAENADTRKDKYVDLQQTYTFIPLAFETFGPI